MTPKTRIIRESSIKKRLFITSEDLFVRFGDKIRNEGIDVVHTEDLHAEKCDSTLDIFLISREFCEKSDSSITSLLKDKKRDSALLYYVGKSFSDSDYNNYFDLIIPEPVNEVYLMRTIKNGFLMIQNNFENEYLRRELNTRNTQLQELSHIGQQLMVEKDLNTLLNLILLKSREITTADAGSLYLVEENEKKKKHLRFMITQNDSVSFEFQEFIMPISRKSIAGFVASTVKMLNIDDVYDLPKDSEYSINKSFDEKIGYRTKSMLVVPLQNHVDEVIGVIQLINRKREWEKRLTKPEDFKNEVCTFTEECTETVTALAGQAAVSIENNLLYQSIERLFEGFVSASITAIESRDPTTYGHSSRVATLTVNMAETVDGIKSGPLKNVCFSKDQIKEIRYASLLHDFGKVGVREHVLLKAKKLYPYQLTEIMYRIGYLKKIEEIKNLQKRIQFLLDYGSKNYQLVFHEMEYELKNKLDALTRNIEFIKEINEPTMMETDKFRHLEEISNQTFIDYNDDEKPFILPEEVTSLSIKKGSLGEREKLEIESHVTHTFNFLRQVPWTKDIKDIPRIALSHHEKLNGGGYPHKLTEDEIPVQSKMISISDIFDALTASDRPYKKAVSFDRALEILQYEVNDNHIDDKLVRLFIDAKIYNSLLKKKE